MSCQSLAAPARPFPPPPPPAEPVCTTRHRSVRFSSESQTSFRRSTNDTECKRETPGSISLTTLVTGLSNSQPGSSMSQSAPSGSATFGDLTDNPTPPLCRFPKLEECAHFHYERVGLGGLRVELVRSAEAQTHCEAADDEGAQGWVCLKVRSHIHDAAALDVDTSHSSSWTSDASVAEWNLTRNADNFRMLDNMLHRCIYDRKVSGLSDLSKELKPSVIEDRAAYESLIEDYVHHLSIIADDSINCGPILNWLQLDNRGHRLLVANEDSSSINTPAVAAAYSVRKYVSQARDEISFEVGDMISIIDMPGPQESLWWRGKRGFKVGFFPHHCVAVIGDKVPRHMTQPPPIVGSVAVAQIKPVLRKHGKLISLFRSFILSRPSRRTLKQQGILRERLFGCDLGEHLLNSSQPVPLVLIECARIIESHGAVDGIYRLSGGSGLTQRLRAAFDEGRTPDLSAPPVLQDIHAVASLLKMYFRELPNPLCTYQLYEGFVSAVEPGSDDATRLRRLRETIVKLPPPHYRTLSYLMRHLRRVSLLGAATGMTARNMAIVWAPNLLRSPREQHALHGVAVQAVVTELLICYAEELLGEEQGECEPSVMRGAGGERSDAAHRPKSLPINVPTKLLSLEEARQRGGLATCGAVALMPPPSGAIAAAANTQLRPSSHKEPKYIEVGSGPNNLPQYHTVIDLPVHGGSKRGLKRSPSGWRGLFSLRSKQQRSIEAPLATSAPQQQQPTEEPCENQLRHVKSCESLHSETGQLAPLSGLTVASISKQHARSSSCDSYFEPWQTELADMRLRLSPQERDGNMFSEEDDTTLNVAQQSVSSTPVASEGCSVEPSPRHPPACRAQQAERSRLEEQLSSIGYIDCDSPRHKPSPEKRHSDEWSGRLPARDPAKRLCTDRESLHSSNGDVFPQTPPSGVKLRERSSPRKNRGSARYSGLHQPLTNLPSDNDTKIVTIVNQLGQNNRMTWHGAKDGHSTLIKIDWPIETSSLTPSTLMSSPLTPVTPVYDALESDSDISEGKLLKNDCSNCDGNKKCLKCELSDANSYENINALRAESNDTNINNAVDCEESNSEKFVKNSMFKETNIDEYQSNLLDKSQSEKGAHESLESSPLTSTNISYQNLNRLSNISTNSSNSDHVTSRDLHPYENVPVSEKSAPKSSVMSSSHESSSSYSNVSPRPNDELYECFSFNRPNYISLQSSGSSKSSSPLKSPLRSTISITFKSPTKAPNDYEIVEVPNLNERDSVYEDVDLDKNLSIVEEATIPETDANLPTQDAAQPEIEDLIILESPVANQSEESETADIYSQVKFFKKSIEEVNAMIVDSRTELKNDNDDPKIIEVEENKKIEKFDIVNDRDNVHYENLDFTNEKDAPYENVILSTELVENAEPELCLDRRLLNEYSTREDTVSSLDAIEIVRNNKESMKPKLSLPIEKDTENIPKSKNLNVRELAHKFESPTDIKGPFSFDKPYETKYPTLDRKKDIQIDSAKSLCESRPKKDLPLKVPPPVSPKTYKLSKYSISARSLDENAFVTEFGKAAEQNNFVMREPKCLPDLNLNTEERLEESEQITPTTENKIGLIQTHFTLPKSPTKSLNFEMDKKLSRERIEKYKEERRNFLREKYSSQSFRNPSGDSKLKRQQEEFEKPSESERNERLKVEESPKFERRNTVDLGQRMRFSLNRPCSTEGAAADDSDTQSEDTKDRKTESPSRNQERKEKMSPSYNIKDMTAMFEQKSHNCG